MNQHLITDQLRQFIAEEFLEGDDEDLNTDSPLLEWGIIDSVGMVNLLAFLEQRFGVHVAQSEITPTNFHSLERISSMVVRQAARPTGAFGAQGEEHDPELVELLEFGAEREWLQPRPDVWLHAIAVHGPAPTCVLLPEPGRSASDYGDVLRALEGHHAAMIFDLAGFGVSTCHNPTPEFWDHAALLSEALPGLGAPVVLAGHGLSAALAFEIAGRAPQRVRAVVSLGFGKLDDPAALLRGGREPQRFVEDRRGPGAVLPVRAMQRLSARLRSPAFEHFLNPETNGLLARLLTITGIPSLFIGGMEDRLVRPPAIEAAAKSMRGAQTKWLARTGHDFPLERPDETVSLILSYIKTLTDGVQA